MKRKFLKERSGIAGLLVILLSLCLALGVWLTMPRTVYADESADWQVESELSGGEANAPVALADDTKINRWLVSPSVLSWKYGEYDPAVNVINAVPAYGTVKVYIFASDGSNIRATFELNADHTVPEDASEKLSGLDAGDYYMLANVPADKDGAYTGLNEGVGAATSGFKFSVLQINNYWSSTPNIIQWSWGGFKRDKNLITAVPAYSKNQSEADVKFGVYTDASCEEEYSVMGLEEFTVTSGKTDADTGRILANLNAGTYYLSAKSAGTVNYTSLNSVVQFEVQGIQNHWKVAPNVFQWKYGEYDCDINTINGEPANGKLEDVAFSIYSDELCNENVLQRFYYSKKIEQVKGESGDPEFIISYVFDDGIYESLGGLNAGRYYLKAELAGEANGNYTELSSVVPFNIQGIQNHWSVTPSVIPWNYGEFDKTVNLIQALPAFGGEAVIAIYHSDGEPVLFDNGNQIVSTFSLENANGVLTVPAFAESALKALGAGKYYMLASVPAEENGNYTGLNEYTSVADIKAHGIEFAVSTVQNSWITVPQILSWSEGHYDSEVNKIVAEARSGNDRLVIYIIEGVDGNGRIITTNAGGNELDLDALAKLSVGSYTVKFEINGNNNYTSLEGVTTFAVFEDSVGLEGIIAAVIAFAVIDVFALGACIVLQIFRRKKIEAAYRAMINKELHRR